MMLTLLLLIPLLGVLTITFIMTYDCFLNVRDVKLIALITSIVNLIVSLVNFILFDFSSDPFQFVLEYHDVSFFDFYLGLGGLSIYFVLLTTLITPFAILSNWNLHNENVRSFFILNLLLEFILLAVFLVLDLTFVYVLSIVVPLFILIGLFGSSNKVRVWFFLFFCVIIILAYYILPYIDVIGLLRGFGIILITYAYRYHRFYMPIHIALYYNLKLFMDNNLLEYLYNLCISFNTYPHSKNTLLCMPFVQNLLPEFTAAGAILTLNTALGLIEGGLHDIGGLSAPEQLKSLQEMQSRLYSVVKDQCAEANAKVAHLNVATYRDDPSYVGIHAESVNYYDSAEFARHKAVNKDLAQKMIALHKEGITNNDSYGNKGLKLKVGDYSNIYQQEYRFHKYYSNRINA